MTEKDIHSILTKGEHLTLECKRAKNGVPNSVWETYSAFANTYGGVILLGIQEDTSEPDITKRFSVVGVEDASKIRTDFWNMANNPEKVSTNIMKDEDVEIITIDGKDVIAISVPPAPYTLRPVYINNNPIRGTYRRNHEGDYHVTEHGVRMLMRDANEEGNDKLFLEYYTMDDIDAETLRRYRQMFRNGHPDHPWEKYDDKEFLKELGGYVVNRREGSEGLTMAGLLMFGKGLPIRERFDNLRMDYIDKTNLIGEERYSDRITYDGTWENNLFNFITMVMPRLTRDLPRPFQMEGVIRVDDTRQHKAVREAVTNSIIHADLMLNGLLRIVKFDDRFEITNPGLLKLPVEQIYEGSETKARNQSIQAMLRMIGYGENIGSGFPLILQAWNEKHWVKPELIEQPDLMQTKLILCLYDTENVTKDVTKKLTDRQQQILQLIKDNPQITTTEMSERMTVTRRTIASDIKSLQHLGIINREGSDKSGFWRIISQ